VGLNNQKGVSHVVDHSGDTDNSVGVGSGKQLHDGRFCSFSAGDCHNCYNSPGYPRPQILTVLTLAKKHVEFPCVRRAGKLFLLL